MEAHAEGDVHLEDKVLVIKRIRVRYVLRGCPDDKREAAERSHAFHASRCPVAKTLQGSVAIETQLTFA
ncbi:MAG: hypothetical protein NVS9B1_08840 [Candidatus Dormibacteraceae bacterium]